MQDSPETLPRVEVLVVEDEPALLGLLVRFVKRLGYEAYGVSSAGDAISAVEASPDRFTVVLTDLTLTDFAGEDLIERLQQIQPALKGIVSSGYPYQPRSADVGFLQKPYLPGMLADALNQVLVVR